MTSVTPPGPRTGQSGWVLAALLVIACGGGGDGTGPTGTAATPVPSGIYVVNEASNLQSLATAYDPGLISSPAYGADVAGHAVFVPIAKILPSVTSWGQFTWDWSYPDSLIRIALAHHKKFSIELETGYQNSASYAASLPAGFSAACGATCAPLIDVWATGGAASRCISAYIPLPWIPKVQQFWASAAAELALHLKQTGAYSSLTLVHLPGLSVYDEELRLPTGFPRPAASDTTRCPDGRPAYPTVITDADTASWRSRGYSDSAVVAGFAAIAGSFAQAFPDRFLGMSLFPPGNIGIDFPNLTADPVGYVAGQLVQQVTGTAPGRVLLQADELDDNYVLPEVLTLAGQTGDAVGWQTNRHGGTGAGCGGGGPGSCGADGPTSMFFQLMQYGAQNKGQYLEVWSADVVAYPQSFAAAEAGGLYPLK